MVQYSIKSTTLCVLNDSFRGPSYRMPEFLCISRECKISLIDSFEMTPEYFFYRQRERTKKKKNGKETIGLVPVNSHFPYEELLLIRNTITSFFTKGDYGQPMLNVRCIAKGDYSQTTLDVLCTLCAKGD